MIRLKKSSCIRGQGYAVGDPYEGPEERFLVRIGRAEFVVPEAPAPAAVEPEAPAPAPVKRRRRRRTAKAE